MTSLPRRIAHLDMDAFFASVELLTYPELRGQPVVVGGERDHQPRVNSDGTHEFARIRNYKGRGVITTSTYEARAFGVFSGMGIMKAAQLAPDAILLPVNFDAYRHYSRLFKEAVATIAPQIENRGIDEIYIDLTDVPGETWDLARRIKQAVKEATGLTCSIGITPNKLLSKICSDLQKPDGITILGMEDNQTPSAHNRWACEALMIMDPIFQVLLFEYSEYLNRDRIPSSWSTAEKITLWDWNRACIQSTAPFITSIATTGGNT